MSSIGIATLSNQVENEYLAFIDQILKLEVLEFPTSACSKLLRELTHEAEVNLALIRKIKSLHLTEDADVDIIDLDIDELKNLRVRLLKTLSCHLDWVNGAQTKKVPWSFIPSVERLAQQIIPNHSPVLYCENEYNYSIRWWTAQKEKLHKYSFISLPRLHRINVLMHVLIGHELFHPKCKDFTDKHKNKAAAEIAKRCGETFPGIDSTTLFGQERLDQITDMLLYAWERALHELMCDMACAEIFGPAALFAMRSLASFSDWNIMPGPGNNFYPPWQYRFEVVWQNSINSKKLDLLWSNVSKSEAQKFGQNFSETLDDFKNKALLESDNGYKLVERDDAYGIAYSQVKQLIPDARKYIVDNLPTGFVTWINDEVLEQVPELVLRLNNGIPPNEIPNISFDNKTERGVYAPEPAQLPSILIAGWIYQIYRESNQNNTEIKTLPYESLCRLLLKACEDSEMLMYHKGKVT